MLWPPKGSGRGRGRTTQREVHADCGHPPAPSTRIVTLGGVGRGGGVRLRPPTASLPLPCPTGSR